VIPTHWLRTAFVVAVIVYPSVPGSALAQTPLSLARTGQAISYGTADDGDVQAGMAWPSPRFTDTGDGTKTDLLTGLQWTKSGYAPGPSACGPGAQKRWQEALDYVACLNANAYLAHTDWRLPNVNELRSLLNNLSTSVSVWLAAQGFTSVQGTSYWTSTTGAYDTADGWIVKATGAVATVTKANRLNVWPVRGAASGSTTVWRTGQTTSYAPGDDGALQAGIAWPNPRFVSTGDCVTDQLTGLMWPRHPDATRRIWRDALSYSNSLELCGYSDWRLPNINELLTVEHFGVSDVAGWLQSQGIEGVQRDRYWSSSSYYTNTSWTWVADLWQGWVFLSVNAPAMSAADYVNWVKTLRNPLIPVRTVATSDPYRILTVERTGSGSGTVASTDSDIACGDSCSKRYPPGTPVTLVATPSSGSTFTGWGGDTACSCGQVTLGSDVRCVAVFDLPPPQYVLTVSKAGSGSGTVRTADTEIECGSVCAATYRPTASVQLVAVPSPGSTFAGWSGDADCSDGQVTMDAARACIARFGFLPAVRQTLVARTGQTTTYTARDDGDLRAGVEWPTPRFTVNGECVTDHLTGLTWLRNPDSMAKGWEQALAYASNFSACGDHDWRLPNINELHTLLTSGGVVFAQLNARGFSLLEGGYYWSSTTDPKYSFDTLIMGTGADVTGGYVNSMVMSMDRRGYRAHVLPVRGTASGPATVWKTYQTSCFDSVGTVIACAGTTQDGDLLAGATWPASRFVVTGDCVTDTATGLMWARNANILANGSYMEEGGRDWETASQFARTLSLCGYSDWRLPNRNEFWTLATRATAQGAAWLTSLGFSTVESGMAYWSSTTTPYAWYYDVAFWTDTITGHALYDKYVAGTTGENLSWPVRSVVGLDTGQPAFTDDPLTPRVTPVRAAHVLELRQRIGELRARTGLGSFPWTDSTLTARSSVARSIHLTELRSALGAVYVAVGLPMPTWTPASVTGGTTVIAAAQISELRSALLAIW
jgi:hypothetical protein